MPVDVAEDADASGPDAAPSFELAAVTPPAWAPCPGGWRTVGEPATCEPWPETVPSCGAGEVLWPGGSECARIGTPCPSDGWPEIPADRRVVYVRPGATNGAGTKTSPYGTIARAMTAAPFGTVIALSRGTHLENVQLRRGVTLWGACVNETIIEAPSGDNFAGAVTVMGDDAEIRNLQITGPRAGVWLDETSATLSNVIVREATSYGVVVAFGGHLIADGLVIAGTRVNDNGVFGYGLSISEGASAQVANFVSEGNRGLGVLVSKTGTELTLTRAVVRDTQPFANGHQGAGVAVGQGASLVASELVVERNHECGVTLYDAGSELSIDHAVLRENLPRAFDGGLGCGLVIRDGSAELRRTRIEGNHYYGLAVGAGAVLEASDLWIRGTVALEPEVGDGLVIEGGASVDLARVLVSENRDGGILLRGATLVVADLTVRDIQSDESTGERGRGIEVSNGASLTGSNVAIERCQDAGLFAADAGTRVSLSEVRIVDTRERSCAMNLCAGFGAGTGLASIRGASVSLERFELIDSALCGAHVIDADLDLRVGRVVRNAIGVNVQAPGYDLRRLSDQVAYVDNGRSLEQQDLPEPDGAAIPAF